MKLTTLTKVLSLLVAFTFVGAGTCGGPEDENGNGNDTIVTEPTGDVGADVATEPEPEVLIVNRDVRVLKDE